MPYRTVLPAVVGQCGGHAGTILAIDAAHGAPCLCGDDGRGCDFCSLVGSGTVIPTANSATHEFAVLEWPSSTAFLLDYSGKELFGNILDTAGTTDYFTNDEQYWQQQLQRSLL